LADLFFKKSDFRRELVSGYAGSTFNYFGSPSGNEAPEIALPIFFRRAAPKEIGEECAKDAAAKKNHK
jgi:hypothetical protein